ncbi:glycosyltransferase [Rubellicoccus peritrichatus]|uniref:Glycosyltransferase n=1 Tax=Rubellicoccus peritrichatus TaxID=3080537 RepID=A0AAQ3QWV3_9BACT|nr:glycosyltransferase [Puniceicoccus sp. CR14]WOO43098.1 glycosyltransferase [Puniceicoccus sp. CR14]
MNVLLTSHGSTGDIYPMISLGRALIAGGHKVSFATTPFFREDVKAAGIRFVRVPPDWDGSQFAESMKTLHRAKSPLRQLRMIYRQASEFLTETVEILENELQGKDLFVGSYLFPNFKAIAERKNVPFALVCFCHNVVPNDTLPPDVVPGLSMLPEPLHKLWVRLWWKISSGVIDATINNELKRVLSDARLEPTSGFCLKPANLVLVAVSPGVMKAGLTGIDSRFNFTGYLRYQTPDDSKTETILNHFCQGERVPLVTFGSVTFDSARAEMREFIANWPKNKKLILQAGWAQFDEGENHENILIIGKASHDQVLRHASAVLHHGGAGTTASVLHSGVPQVIAPQIADQGFWANQVVRLGVGLKASPRGWPQQAPRFLQKVSSEEAFQRRAKECQSILNQENGQQNAVALLEQYVGSGPDPT